jgi:hypothetical protein
MATVIGVSPPGWEKTVERMKEHPEIDNPFALSWWLHNQGENAAAICDDERARTEAYARYKEACKAGAVAETIALAAAGESWAQAVCLGQRLGAPFHVYREPPS